MRTIFNLVIGSVITAILTSAAFAQTGEVSASQLRSLAEVKATRGLALRPESVSAIKPENVNAYYFGFDFEDAKHLVEEDKAKEAVISLVILWDGLQGTAEAAQVENVLRMVVRGQGSPSERVTILEMAQKSLEQRLAGEQKWFYSVGQTYGAMLTHICSGKIASVKAKMIEMGRLAKTAPAGTPSTLVGALAKLGAFGTKSSYTDDDITAITVQWDAIENAMKA